MASYENAGLAVWRIQKMRPIDVQSRIVVEDNLTKHVWDRLPVDVDHIQVDGLVFERPNCACSELPESIWDLDTVRRYILRVTVSESLVHHASMNQTS